MPRVSAVIPTFQRREVTAACVASLLAQTRRPDEIVFVDDSPDDEIETLHAELVKAHPEMSWRFLRNPGRPSLTRSRNIAIDATDSDVVAFFDSDCIVDADYIREGLDTLAGHMDAMAVRGIEVDRRPYPVLYRAYRWLWMQPITSKRKIKVGFPPTFTRYGTRVEDVRRSESMKGSNMMIRRAALDDVRFDDQMERYSLFEDIDYALALRERFPGGLYCNPRMKVDHAADEEGRIPEDDRVMMLYVNKHYLAHKHYHVGPLRRLKLWWSDVGYVVMRGERDPAKTKRLWRVYRRVKRLLKRHEDDLRRGDLETLNRYYTWMDGPDHGL